MARLDTNLTGEALLRDLSNTGNAAVLGALWRVEEPGLCARLLPHIGATMNTGLGGLVLDEFLKPRMASPVPEAILRAVSSKEPPMLSVSDAARLIERLRAEPNRQGQFRPGRAAAELWALAQGGPDARAFAKDIATEDVPYSRNEAVTNLARRRAMETGKLRDEVARRLFERLTGERSAPAWIRAAGYLHLVPADQDSASLRSLTDQVVEDAPRLAPALFSEALKRRVAAAPEAAERRLAQGPIQNGAGGQSIVQVIEMVEQPEIRGRMTAQIVLRQAELYAALRGSFSGWVADEWKVRLTGLAGTASAQPTTPLIDILSRAPHEHAPLIMRAAARHGAPDHQNLRAAAVSKVKGRFGEIVADGFTAQAV